MSLENVERRFYTPKDLRELIDRGVTVQTIHRYVHQGKIPSIRFGKRILIPAGWVAEYLKTGKFLKGDENAD